MKGGGEGKVVSASDYAFLSRQIASVLVLLFREDRVSSKMSLMSLTMSKALVR